MPGIGPARAHRLAAAFGSPERVFSEPVSVLVEHGHLNVNLAETLKALDWPGCVEAELRRCRLVRCRTVTLADAEYPARLREIPLPPPVLYVRGTLTPADEKSLSLVGCRRPSDYGQTAAREFGRALAEAGITVVSGLARGIDAAAHAGALEAPGGRTLAVVAHGLDRIYPEEHRDLHDRIAASGAVISEFALGVAPLKENFPRRNRLISGLTPGVFVVEAGERSGALITARWAAEQGRDVFALPGRYDEANAQGTNALIQDGAKLVMNLRDILEEMDWALPETEAPPAAAQPGERNLFPALSPEQQKIYAALQAGVRHVDELAAECGRPVSQLLHELLRMELQGWVRPNPGGFYSWNEN
ncbi:MAG: DNA-protecting protein DprA [Candidatus Firestonebacteria bacterium]|nr:DNA-protecting protein DprA [Candidatus Firestonebacteria bacterium]